MRLRHLYKALLLLGTGGFVFQTTAGCFNEETSALFENLMRVVVSMALTLQMGKLSF